MTFAPPQKEEAVRMANSLLFLLGYKPKSVRVITLPKSNPDQPWETAQAAIVMETDNGKEQTVFCKVNFMPDADANVIIRNLMHAIAFTFTVAPRQDGAAIWAAVEKYKREQQNGHRRHQKRVTRDSASYPGNGREGVSPKPTEGDQDPAGAGD